MTTDSSFPMKRVILAVVGMPGAGKTEAVKSILSADFTRVYFGQAVFDELEARGLPVTEANERLVRDDLRQKYGMGAMGVLGLPKVKEALAETGRVVIESLYSWDEYKLVKNEFGDDFVVLGIYASPKTRIKRLGIRPERQLTAEEVRSRDYSQIEDSASGGPIARADFTINNEGSLDDLARRVKKVVELLIEEKVKIK